MIRGGRLGKTVASLGNIEGAIWRVGWMGVLPDNQMVFADVSVVGRYRETLLTGVLRVGWDCAVELC
jgi:hypothetical protein